MIANPRQALRSVGRIVMKHRYPIIGIVAMSGCLFWMFGCASTRVTPASNESKVTQTDSPQSKRVTLTIGGKDAALTNGPKTQSDRR